MFLKYMAHISFWSRNVGVLRLKTIYIEFAWLESSADATPAVMLCLAIVMAAEVHCTVLYCSHREDG